MIREAEKDYRPTILCPIDSPCTFCQQTRERERQTALEANLALIR